VPEDEKILEIVQRGTLLSTKRGEGVRSEITHVIGDVHLVFRFRASVAPSFQGFLDFLFDGGAGNSDKTGG
jgi:hypothetical protein